MKLRRSLLLLFLSFLMTEAARAQGKTSLFSAPITVSSGVDHAPGPNGTLVPESSLLITPIHPLFLREDRRSSFRLSYAPELEVVRNGTSNVALWNHAADFSYGHLTGQRTRYTFAHSFVRNSDPSRVFQDSLFVLSHKSFRQNASAIAVRHDLTRRTSLGVRFDNTITRISANDRLDGTYLNGYGVVGTVSLTRHVTERQKFTGSYSILKFSPYQFESGVDADRFLSSLPTIRAGISRFAMTVGLASADAATAPGGMLGGSRMGRPADSPETPATTPAPGIQGGVGGPLASIGSSSGYDGGFPAGPLVGIVTPPLSSSGTIRTTASSQSSSLQTPVILAATDDSGNASTPADPALTTTASSPKDIRLLGDPFHTAAVTYTFQRSRGLQFELTGGVMAEHDVSYLLGAQIEKASDRIYMSVGFQHFLSYYGPVPVAGIPTTTSLRPPGTSARSAVSTAMITVSTRITRRTELALSASVSNSTANFVEHHVRSLVSSARINHWLTDRFGIFATMDSVAEDRKQPGATAFNRQRYFGGIQIRMSPPHEGRVFEQ